MHIEPYHLVGSHVFDKRYVAYLRSALNAYQLSSELSIQIFSRVLSTFVSNFRLSQVPAR